MSRHNPYPTPERRAGEHWGRTIARHAYAHGAAALHEYASRPTHHHHNTYNEKHHHKHSHMHGKEEEQKGIEFNYYHVIVKKHKPKAVMSGKYMRWFDTNAHLLTCPVGTQLIATPCMVATTDQCMFDTSAANDFGSISYASPKGYINLNPTEGIQMWGGVTAQIATDKFFLRNVSICQEYRNMTSVPCHVQVYCLKSKTWHNNAPDNLLTRMLLDTSNGFGAQTYPGAGAKTGGAFGSLVDGTLGLLPTHLSAFKKFWTIAKMKTFSLDATATETINWNVLMNFTVDVQKIIEHNDTAVDGGVAPKLFTSDPATWRAENVSNRYQPGTVAFLVVARAALVMDKTAGASTIVPGNVELGVMNIKNHDFQPYIAPAKRIETTVGFEQIAKGAAVGVQKQINEVDVVDQEQDV